jgi:hypothetical protein
MDGSAHGTVSVRTLSFFSFSEAPTFVHPSTLNFFICPFPPVKLLTHSRMYDISSVTTIEGWFIYNTNWDFIIEAAARRNESA